MIIPMILLCLCMMICGYWLRELSDKVKNLNVIMTALMKESKQYGHLIPDDFEIEIEVEEM